MVSLSTIRFLYPAAALSWIPPVNCAQATSVPKLNENDGVRNDIATRSAALTYISNYAQLHLNWTDHLRKKTTDPEKTTTARFTIR